MVSKLLYLYSLPSPDKGFRLLLAFLGRLINYVFISLPMVYMYRNLDLGLNEYMLTTVAFVIGVSFSYVMLRIWEIFMKYREYSND